MKRNLRGGAAISRAGEEKIRWAEPPAAMFAMGIASSGQGAGRRGTGLLSAADRLRSGTVWLRARCGSA